ncbi:hypothetical protein FW774_18365 [Pedobacter sp. BS3]|uniref:hypothetical protein n=1 Tax=Pedobacter sp. BS3 TaxID=2567937 RepID=UPI0011EC04CC|nr:hypothetical protein [Pedobacter sp. BS3]TZF81517.1 hypothetical protein FW774_18365 [Pedobacter sp. BS3]
MKKIAITLIAFFIFHSAVNAQGKWNGAEVTIKYNLSGKAGKAKFSGSAQMVQSVSINGEEQGILPAPEKGAAKLSIDANTGASFALQGKGSAVNLKMVASSGKPTETSVAKISKFALYRLPTSAVTAFSFTLTVNSYATSGEIMIPFGNTATDAPDNTNTFNNGIQMSEWWDTKDLFGAIKLEVFEGEFIAYSYRQPRMGTKDTEAPRFIEIKEPTPFNKGKAHAIEIYCNNSDKAQTYTRDGVSFEVAPQTYQWWVNGKHIKINVGLGEYNFPSSKETALGSAINSISFNTSGSITPRPNALEFLLGNISVQSIK